MPLSNVSPAEILMVLAIALVVLGPRRLPDVARSIGKGVREFKASLDGIGLDSADERPARDVAPPAPEPTMAAEEPAPQRRVPDLPD